MNFFFAPFMPSPLLLNTFIQIKIQNNIFLNVYTFVNVSATLV